MVTARGGKLPTSVGIILQLNAEISLPTRKPSIKVNRAGSAFARPFAARALYPQPSRRNSHWDSGERAKSPRSNARRGWLLRSSGMDLAIVRARDAVGAEYFGSIFYVRFRGTPESAFTAMRAILRNADPALPATFRTLDERSTDP